MEKNSEKPYKTIANRAEIEFIEKRSRFIGCCAPASNEKQALDFISEIKTQNKTANHNVWAYSIRENNLMRFTDDGEPSGTAGLPVLDVIKRGNIVDAVIVVTRYFGGTLLGTGGLVRAYGESASLVVKESGIAVMAPCCVYSFECTYPDYDRMAKLLQNIGATVTESEFTDKIALTVALLQENSEKMCVEISELTRGVVFPKYITTQFKQISIE